MQVLAAITTPFGADGALDLDAFEAHVRWLGEAGLDGLFVAGTTGEGVLLEHDEVEALAERAAAAAGPLRVIVQVGRPSTGATVALARRALAAGAHGVAAYVPWFYPVTQEQVRAHFLALLEAAGDAPAFLYNIPPRTVNDLSPAARRRAGAGRLRGDEGLHRRSRAPPRVPGGGRLLVRGLHRHRAADRGVGGGRRDRLDQRAVELPAGAVRRAARGAGRR